MGAVRRFKQPEIKVRNGAKIRDLKGQGNNFPTLKLTPIVTPHGPFPGVSRGQCFAQAGFVLA